MRRLAVLPLLLLITGCAITQTVDPVDGPTNREICLIRNPDVRENFFTAYRDALAAKGFTVRVLDGDESPGACALTTRYVANWRWDLAWYLAFARLEVFANGTEVGEALYDSLRGGANPSKFIDAERKLVELVDQLFPNPSFVPVGAPQ